MKLLIFDLDGTIIDSSEDLLNAVNFALENRGFHSISYEFLKLHIGEPLEKVFCFAINKNNLSMEDGILFQLRKDFVSYSKKHLIDNSKIFDGLENFLRKEKSQLQVIATTKPTYIAKKIAHLMGFEKYFQRIFGCEKLPPKPDPSLINHILKYFSLKPEEALMIGDTDKDLLAGKLAGVKTCLALYGFGDKVKSLSLRPDYVINSPEELNLLISSFPAI